MTEVAIKKFLKRLSYREVTPAELEALSLEDLVAINVYLLNVREGFEERKEVEAELTSSSVSN